MTNIAVYDQIIIHLNSFCFREDSGRHVENYLGSQHQYVKYKKYLFFPVFHVGFYFIFLYTSKINLFIRYWNFHLYMIRLIMKSRYHYRFDCFFVFSCKYNKNCNNCSLHQKCSFWIKKKYMEFIIDTNMFKKNTNKSSSSSSCILRLYYLIQLSLAWRYIRNQNCFEFKVKHCFHYNPFNSIDDFCYYNFV